MARGRQVVEGLTLVLGRQLRHRFDLKNDLVFNHKVGHIVSHRLTFVVNRRALLPFEADASKSQFVR